eukprot:8620200-Alexandrium_andersonii.AAC.1
MSGSEVRAGAAVGSGRGSGSASASVRATTGARASEEGERGPLSGWRRRGRRPRVEQGSPSTWYCQMCTFLNSGWLQECEVCNAGREGAGAE